MKCACPNCRVEVTGAGSQVCRSCVLECLMPAPTPTAGRLDRRTGWLLLAACLVISASHGFSITRAASDGLWLVLLSAASWVAWIASTSFLLVKYVRNLRRHGP